MPIYTWTGSGWSPGTIYPSGGKLSGIRMGFNGGTGAVNSGSGTGLLTSVIIGNGTGATGTVQNTNATDGNNVGWATGTSNVFARAGWWSQSVGGASVLRKFNPTFTVRFRLFQAQTSSQGMMYFGFVNQSAQPAAGTSMLSTYLDTKIGVLFGFRPADTTFMIISNNAQTLATYTTAGTPNSSATDTSAHTLTLQITDSPAQINWWFDGVQMTSITDTTNNVPPSTTLLFPLAILEAQTATAISWFERWSQIYMDAP
jgi:hypothetical protein